MQHPDTIGNNIRMWLIIRKMKPLELAKKMDVSEGYLSQIINSSDEKINKNQERKLEIAEHLKIEPGQLDTNPMQVFNLKNGNIDGSNNVNSVQNAYLSEPEILLKLKSLLSTFNELVEKLEKNNTL